MLELKKTEHSPQLEQYCVQSGAPWEPGLEYFAATCGGLVGCCAFSVAGEALTIQFAAADDDFGPALCDGLIRAVYQHALGRGAKTAEFAPSFPEPLWHALSEFGHTDKTDNDIDKFLTNCKNCAH